MDDLTACAESLRRPSILIRAARHGLTDYNRGRDLRRLMREPDAPPPAVAVRRLMDEEALAEMRRQSGDAAYSLTRHVDLLIALMAELRLLRLGGGGQP
jgi:hypothetical protein